MGVFRPNLEVFWKQFGPLNQALFDFPALACRSIDRRAWWNSRDGHQIEVPGHLAGLDVGLHDGTWERRYTEACYGKNYET